jgi:uncharacterized protein YjbK
VAYRFRSAALRITRADAGATVHYVVEDEARSVRHRLYEVEYEVAQLLDGKRAADKVARQVSKKLGVNLAALDVESFAKQLLALGFVEEV